MNELSENEETTVISFAFVSQIELLWVNGSYDELVELI